MRLTPLQKEGQELDSGCAPAWASYHTLKCGERTAKGMAAGKKICWALVIADRVKASRDNQRSIEAMEGERTCPATEQASGVREHGRRGTKTRL